MMEGMANVEIARAEVAAADAPAGRGGATALGGAAPACDDVPVVGGIGRVSSAVARARGGWRIMPGAVRWGTIGIALAAPVLFAVAVLGARVLMARSSGAVAVQVSVVALVAAAAFLAFIGGLVHLREHWRMPARRLAQKLRELQSGVASVEELMTLPAGGLGPLLEPIAEILRELREQKYEAARLSDEMGQRVARRTDALERKLGSLREQAIRDPLTGLHNRRVLGASLQALLDRARASNLDLCVLAIDLDHFKHLNDTLGHPAGDELLRSIGQLIRSSVRDKDLGFRCGGDEFVIVMPDATLEAGQRLTDRLVSLVDALATTLHVDKKPGLSIGIVTLSSQASVKNLDAEMLLAEADKRLYTQKAIRKGTGAKKSAA